MKDNPHRREREEMKELLLQYQNLKSGNDLKFLEEESFERIIDYYDENQQLNFALEAAECGIRRFPYSSLLLIKKADLLIASNKYSAALDVLDKVSVLDISDMNLHILKIDAYLGMENREKAKSLFMESVNLYEGTERIEFLFELADVFDDYEQFDEVFECLKSILLQDSLNQEALYKICFWTDYAGKFDESIQLHKKLIDEHPYNHLAWFNLGAALQGLKLYEKAIDAYLYSTAIDEKFDYAYRNLGDAYIRVKNYKDAIGALEKVLELSIPEDVIYEALGHCHEKLKEPAQARAFYRKALHMNPEDSHLYYKIATTYMLESKWKNAIDQLTQAIRILPKSPDYHFALGQCYSKLGNVNDAVTSFGQYISYRPTSIKGWKELVTVLFDNGYYDEALRECDEGYKMTKGKMIFAYFKSAVYLKLGKKKEGLLLLENCLEKSPKSLKEFIALNPGFLQRPSIVRLINRHLDKKEKSKKKRK